MKRYSNWLVTPVATITLASCGGGGGGVSVTPQYTIGGTVSGLSGAGLVLQATGAGTVTVSSSGSFQFPSAVTDGTAYTISVRTQPTNPSQICSVSSATGSGTVAGANVTNVAVTCATNTGHFAYAVNYGSNDISGYAVDSATGALAEMSGSPFAAGNAPVSLTIHPSGKFAYVSNGGEDTISEYTIDSTSGALAPITGSPLLVTPVPSIRYPPTPVGIDPSGRLAFVGNSNAPVFGNPAAQPSNLAVYHIDAASGMLTPIAGSPLTTNTAFPDFVFVDPAGKFAYLLSDQLHAGVDGSAIASFAIDSDAGTITPVSGSPFGPFQPLPMIFGVAPNGKFAYMASNLITGLEPLILNGTTGAVTAGATIPMQARFAAAVDASSRFIYLTDGSAVGGYSIDSTTGAVTPISGTPITLSNSLTLLAMTVDPTGKFLYVTAAEVIYTFAIDVSNGALTAVPGSPFTVANSPDLFNAPLAIDPSGRFAYLPSRNSKSLYALRIDPLTGALTPVPGSPFTAGNSSRGIVFLH